MSSGTSGDVFALSAVPASMYKRGSLRLKPTGALSSHALLSVPNVVATFLGGSRFVFSHAGARLASESPAIYASMLKMFGDDPSALHPEQEFVLLWLKQRQANTLVTLKSCAPELAQSQLVLDLLRFYDLQTPAAVYQAEDEATPASPFAPAAIASKQRQAAVAQEPAWRRALTDLFSGRKDGPDAPRSRLGTFEAEPFSDTRYLANRKDKAIRIRIAGVDAPAEDTDERGDDTGAGVDGSKPATGLRRLFKRSGKKDASPPHGGSSASKSDTKAAEKQAKEAAKAAEKQAKEEDAKQQAAASAATVSSSKKKSPHRRRKSSSSGGKGKKKSGSPAVIEERQMSFKDRMKLFSAPQYLDSDPQRIAPKRDPEKIAARVADMVGVRRSEPEPEPELDAPAADTGFDVDNTLGPDGVPLDFGDVPFDSFPDAPPPRPSKPAPDQLSPRPDPAGDAAQGDIPTLEPRALAVPRDGGSLRSAPDKVALDLADEELEREDEASVQGFASKRKSIGALLTRMSSTSEAEKGGSIGFMSDTPEPLLDLRRRIAEEDAARAAQGETTSLEPLTASRPRPPGRRPRTSMRFDPPTEAEKRGIDHASDGDGDKNNNASDGDGDNSDDALDAEIAQLGQDAAALGIDVDASGMPSVPTSSVRRPSRPLSRGRLRGSEAVAAAAAASHPLDKPRPYNKHPKYKRYFAMLRTNIPRSMIIIVMEKDGVDPAILDHPDDIPDE